MSWIPLPQPNFNNFQTIDIQNLELKFNNLVNSINGVFDNILTPTVGGVAVKAKIFAQADSTIPATTLTGTILAGALNQANQRFTSDIVFSTLDYDTVQWTSGTIRFNDGTTYAISAGNTGNMTALTFIYFDSALSTTTLKVTTDYNLLAPSTAVLLADAKNAPTTDLNPFWVAYNSANLNVNQLSVNYLSALSGDMGTLTAGSIVVGSTNKIWLNDSADGALNIGGSVKASAPFRVTSAGLVTISNVSGGNTTTISSTGTYALSAGTTGSPQFTVNHTGAVTASNIVVTGGSISIGGETVVTTGGLADMNFGQSALYPGPPYKSLFINSGKLTWATTRVSGTVNNLYLDSEGRLAMGDIAVGIISTGTWNGTAIAAAYLGAHNHAASDVNSGTFADARIAQSNVTQHQAALSIAQSQITGGYSNPLGNQYAVSSDVAQFVGVYIGTVTLTIGGTAYTLLKV